MTDPRSFGAWLQRERERRGVALRAIADRTKIGVALLESLERGDISRWPGGIYRRSFVRAYANLVGLDPDLVLANFERLFPDPDAIAALDRLELAPAAPRPGAEAVELRLQFGAPPLRPGAAALRTAACDVALALAFGLIGLLAAGAVGFWSATAVSALAWHVCGVLGLRRIIQAPVSRAIGHWTSRRAQAREMVAELAELPDPQPDPALDLTYYAR